MKVCLSCFSFLFSNERKDNVPALLVYAEIMIASSDRLEEAARAALRAIAAAPRSRDVRKVVCAILRRPDGLNCVMDTLRLIGTPEPKVCVQL